MKNIFKKNQIIIGTVALMLIMAGYMNYTSNTDATLQAAGLIDSEQYADLGDATLVSANVTNEEDNKAKESINVLNEDVINNSNLNTIVETSSVNNDNNQYFTQSKLDRDNMYSQMIESYQKILENSTVGSEQKGIAEQEIANINNRKNAIMIAENLIKNKGFENVLIFTNNDSVNVVIQAEILTSEKIAQIQNIVVRELNCEIGDIHISNK